MKAPLLAVSAMIVFTACNREAKRDAGAPDAASRSAEEIREEAARTETGEKSLSDKAREAGRQAEHDIGEKASATGSKVGEEARQTGRDIKEGASAAGSKVSEEARQTTRDLKNAMDGDKAVTDTDKKTMSRIRAAWKKDPEAAKEADDVEITVDNGAVRLRGTVTSAEAKKEMARIAGKEAGVAKVTDDVKLAERVGTGAESD